MALNTTHDQSRPKARAAAAVVAAAPPSQLRHIAVTGRNNGRHGVGGGGCETGAVAGDAWLLHAAPGVAGEGEGDVVTGLPSEGKWAGWGSLRVGSVCS